MNDDAIVRRLSLARRNVEAATADLAAAMRQRDEAIDEATAAGWTLRRIADELAITFARVRQLRKKNEEANDGSH
jgi:hypothetical protein